MVSSTNIVAPLFDRVAALYDLDIVQRFTYRIEQNHVMTRLRELRPERILDVGCGTGLLTIRMLEELSPTEIHGCDLSEGMLAKAKARSSAVNWLHGRSEALPLPDASVDAVTCTESFHFYDKPAALAEFHRVLTPGGHVVISMINPRLAPAQRILDWQAFGQANWPSPRQMRRLFTEAGFRDIQQSRVPRPGGPLIPNYVWVATR
ncbi:class I SAM-dependent methyltransferase [Nocardia inohanensis]|uniref:class I SAM-dependent methyltransferase n=1 Tax=Nocardia inohanensis TaxID=209246 RepID=UPI000834819F|nr:methyltransferase domain-containing protein [Nocardia inohanensis]